MKRKSGLVLKKCNLYVDAQSDQTSSVKRKSKCSIISSAHERRKKLRNRLPDIETLLCSTADDTIDESDLSIDITSTVNEEGNCLGTLDLTKDNAVELDTPFKLGHDYLPDNSTRFDSPSDFYTVDCDNDYVELSVADVSMDCTGQIPFNGVNSDQNGPVSMIILNSEQANQLCSTSDPVVPVCIESSPLIQYNTRNDLPERGMSTSIGQESSFSLDSQSFPPLSNQVHVITDNSFIPPTFQLSNTSDFYKSIINTDKNSMLIHSPTSSQFSWLDIGDSNGENETEKVNQSVDLTNYKPLADETLSLNSKPKDTDKWPRKQKRDRPSKGRSQAVSSQWTDIEISILTQNVEKFAQNHDCSPEEIIHNWEKEKRGGFYKIIAEGINRPLNSVYRKTLRLYPKLSENCGKFTKAEVKVLETLYKEHGPDWVKIGAKMHRSAESVRNKYRCVLKVEEKEGAWSEEEIDRLIGAIERLYGKNTTHGDESDNSESSEDYRTLPTINMNWNSISKIVKSRNARQCRFKWIHSVYSLYANSNKSNGQQRWSTDDTLALLESLIDSNANHEDQVDWVQISSKLHSIRSPQWLRRFWTIKLKRTIGNGQAIKFTDALVKLQKFFHECNQLFDSGLDMCEEDLICSSLFDYQSDLEECEQVLFLSSEEPPDNTATQFNG